MSTFQELVKQLDEDVARLEERLEQVEKIKGDLRYAVEWISIQREKKRLEVRARILDSVVRSGEAWRY